MNTAHKEPKYSSLKAMFAGVSKMLGYDPDYYLKQIHEIPDAPVVERIPFLKACAYDKKVLNIGSSSGELHSELKKVAKEIWGLDKDSKADIKFDLDDLSLSLVDVFPLESEVIICGEVLEHLSNPGFFLERLKHFPVPLVLSVPNAFSPLHVENVKKGIENVNLDHVAWYSYHTLKTLVERYNYEVKEFYWYNGLPRISEGLIMVIE